MKYLLGKLSATQITIISFLFICLFGGLCLFISEKNTQFNYDVPEVKETILKPIDQTPEKGERLDERVEEHTYIIEKSRIGLPFVDAVFTATSAVCVTGLTTIDFSSFSLTGQIIVMILIQIGGLGIIVFTSIFAIGIFRGLSERAPIKQLLSGVMDTTEHEVLDMLKYVSIYTFLIEFTATAILAIYLSLNSQIDIGGANPIWWSLFHSVSAFNNAGFSLMQNNLANYPTDVVINITIGSLIVLGGLGYPVLIAIYAYIRSRVLKRNGKVQKQLNEDIAGTASVVQIRVAIIGTILLILGGTITFFILEHGSNQLAGYTPLQEGLISMFHSISTRTAGFNTVDVGSLKIGTIIIFMILMFIGANPAGTAGGVKITTVAVLYGYIKDWFRKPGQPVVLLKRPISKFAVSHAIRLFFFSVIYIFLAILVIVILENEFLSTADSIFNLEKIMFEVVSAFGTVGLSMGFPYGVTSFSGIFTTASKVVIIVTMYFGRVGALTILQSLPGKHPDAHTPISEDFENAEKIQIG